jgi:hypothetical protein
MTGGFAAGVSLQLALSVLAALTTAGSNGRRWVGLLGALGMFAIPWVGDSSIARAVLCVASIASYGRVIDLARERRALSAQRRIWHVLSPIDSWQALPAERRLDPRALGSLAFWVPVGALGYFAAREASELQQTPLYWGARWAAGLLLIYALAETIHSMLAAVYALGGREIPIQHRTPAAARSVREFWGSRWNRTVSRWLDRSVFRSWARRGAPRSGWTLSFIISAAVHAYLVEVAVGPQLAAWMGVYFLVQGLLVLIELRLHVDRWSVVSAHVWVVTAMVLTSPLFTEPFLCVLGLER